VVFFISSSKCTSPVGETGGGPGETVAEILGEGPENGSGGGSLNGGPLKVEGEELEKYEIFNYQREGGHV